MHPNPPNVGAPGAPAQPPSQPQPTTSRPSASPTEIAAFRAAQSANDRVVAVSNQLNQLTNLVGGVLANQQAQTDESFYATQAQQFAEGTIDQAVYTRRIAERQAQRTIAATPPPFQPQPQAQQPQPQRADPQAEARVAKEYGSRAIVLSLGLQGNEPGLDFSSPRRLLETGQQVAAASGRPAPVQTPAGGLNVNQAMGELARQQGFVIPHTDGGHPAAASTPVGEEDLHRITTSRRNKNAPQRMIAELREARDSMAARVGTLQTGEGLLGAPSAFRAQ